VLSLRDSLILVWGVLSCFTAFGLSSALAEDLVIIAVSGPTSNFERGQILDEQSRLDLQEGTGLSLMTQAGEVIELKGPFLGQIPTENKPSSEENESFLSTVSNLILGVKKQSTVIGAARRTLPIELADKNHLLINVDSSGNRCIPNDGAHFWRKNNSQMIDVSLRSDSARLTGIKWPENSNLLALPKAFHVDGDLLVVRLGKEPRRLILHVQPQDLDGEQIGHVLKWMLSMGCERQAVTLLNGLSETQQ